MAGAFNRDTLLALLDLTRDDRNAWTLHLFKNDVTPDDTFTNASVVEANFDGYASIAMTSWGLAFLNAANIAESDEILRIFICTGAGVANTIYGYFMRDAGGLYVGGQRNPAGGVVINAAGQDYPVIPIVTLENG